MKRFLTLFALAIGAFVIYSCIKEINTPNLPVLDRDVYGCDLELSDGCCDGRCQNTILIQLYGDIISDELTCMGHDIIYCTNGGITRQPPSAATTTGFGWLLNPCAATEGDSNAVYLQIYAEECKWPESFCDELDGCLETDQIVIGWQGHNIIDNSIGCIPYDLGCDPVDPEGDPIVYTSPDTLNILLGWVTCCDGLGNCGFTYNDDWYTECFDDCCE